MKQTSVEFGLFVPVAVVTGASILALIVLMVVLAGRVDEGAAARQRVLVANALYTERTQALRAVEPLVRSDPVFAKADAGLDRAWLAGNLAGPVARATGADKVFVLDRDDSPVAASAGETPAALSSFAGFAPAFAPLLDQVRTVEAHGPATPGGSLESDQIAKVGDETYILTASVIEPASTRRPERGPLLLTARRLDLAFLRAFGDRFLLDDLRLGRPDAPEDGASLILRGAGGKPLARLAWRPAAPGRQLYAASILPILLVVISLAGIAFLTFGRGKRMAQGLLASEARAKHMALHDSLTTLANRVLFTDRLVHAMNQLRRGPGRVAVLCIDLDRFKEVNDTFGHHCGDDLLREAARRLVATCRASDTLARLGGDEFAVVQGEATAQSAAALARRINLAMAAPVELGVGKVFIGCSVGITLVDNADLDPAEALRQADLALYRAKDAGKGQYCFFEPEMDAAVRMRRAFEGDLREAIANGDLQMVYQTQVDGRGEPLGVEALLRWTHPHRGAVSPSFFVPIAEECGLIEDLGAYALKTAFTDSLRWPARLKVAVNIAASQLRLHGFLATVARLVEETGADPRRFELEITEAVFQSEDPKVHATLEALRRMGFTLALDDFGTGPSSLSHLRRYPVDRIKIDRSFVAALGADQGSDAVVDAIVKLAGALNLSVMAEGVETVDQRRRLTAVGCGDAQGFLFSRPVDAEEMDRILGAVAA